MIARRTLQRYRKEFAACACLLAVLCLWAPLIAAAAQASGMGCCASGTMCPLHGHAHQRDASAQKAAGAMDCAHHLGQTSRAGLTDCRLSCCHTDDPVITAAAIFVLPAAIRLTAANPSDPLSPASSFGAPRFFLDPAFPPPRSISFLS